MRPMFATIVFLGIISPAMAALDQETKTPYQLRVVIRIADHPEFTEFFRRDLKQQLQGNLQSGRVEAQPALLADSRRLLARTINSGIEMRRATWVKNTNCMTLRRLAARKEKGSWVDSRSAVLTE